jgi:hypothetical protein
MLLTIPLFFFSFVFDIEWAHLKTSKNRYPYLYRNDIQTVITKTKIAGFGLFFQRRERASVALQF